MSTTAGEATTRVEETDEILTVPNALSLARLVLFGWFVYELFYPRDRLLATIALGLAGITDYLDGYIARRFNQASALGRLLDPAVDRVMTVGTLVSIMVAGAIPVWFGLLVLCREVAVSLGALVVATRRAEEIQVSFLGKLGTFGFMCALPLLVLGGGPGALDHAIGIGGLVIVVPSAGVAFVSAWGYLPKIRHARRAATGT